MWSRAINLDHIFDTPPPTPIHRHFTGDPDSSPEVFGTRQNMTNNIPIKLPEFWESAAAAWFAQAESQFAVRGITDDDTCYHHVVASLSSSTASRAVGFITNPPPTRRYAALKAHLLRLFELSLPERARRLLDISGLGDRKPSEHMEMMLNLLGDQEPNFLFRELFLRHMPPHVQTALAGSTATDPRALAEEADRYFLATHRQASELLAPVRAFSTPRNTQRQQRSTGRSDETASQDDLCYFHARFGPRARTCRSPCAFKKAGNEKAHAP